MNENQYPNQQGYPQQGYPQQQYQGQPQQWQNQQYQGQQVPPQQQQWQGQQVPPQQQWQGQRQQPQQMPPQGQWQQPQPPKKSNTGLIVGIIIGVLVVVFVLPALIILPALSKYMKKAEESKNQMNQHTEVVTQYDDDSDSDSHNDSGKDSTDSKQSVIDYDYFVSKDWIGLNDTALIEVDENGTFTWFRDRDNQDGDYYSGTFKFYTGDEAVNYITTESEVKDNVTEEDIKENEAPEYGATRENFVCFVITNEKEVFHGEENTYEPADQVTTTLYGYFVNDKDGEKLTLIKYGNPYEFNLVPEEK